MKTRWGNKAAVAARLALAIVLCAGCCLPWAGVSPFADAFADDGAAAVDSQGQQGSDDGSGEAGGSPDGGDSGGAGGSGSGSGSGEGGTPSSGGGDSGGGQGGSDSGSGGSGSGGSGGADTGQGGDGGGSDSPDNPQGERTAPAITAPMATDLPAATVGEAYAGEDGAPVVTFQAQGAPKPVFYLMPKMNDRGEVTEIAKSSFRDGHAYWSNAGLPKGLELSQSTGEILGTPEDDGGKYPRTFTFTVAATNDVAPDASRTYRITVGAKEAPATAGVVVPDCSGMSQAQALRELAKLGLSAKVTRRASSTVAENRVMSQDPAPGTEANAGDTVQIVVSKGDGSKTGDPVVLQVQLYAHAVDDAGGYAGLLGNNGRESSEGAWWVPGGIRERGGQVRLSASVTMSDGRTYYQDRGEWPDDLVVAYSSSNVGVASVGKGGVVTATGDGTATLAANVDGIVSEMKCKVIGQSSAYPVEVQVTDAKGRDYGDERVTFKEIADGSYAQLYARVVMNDGTTACTAPDAKDYVDPSGKSALARALAGIHWTTSNTQKAYVNEGSGFFKPRDYGTFKVYADVESAGSDRSDGLVRGYLWVVVDSGEYATASPSNTLNVKVVYQLDEGRVMEEKSFSLSKLRSIENVQSTYTFTSTNSETGERTWATASARGMYLTTLLGLMNVGVDDLYAMRLAANDGVNPGLLTSDFLFHERYYWPNYEFNCNMAGGRLVFPMIAYESDWRDSSRGASSTAEDYSGLDDGVRFRLMFGAIGTSDGTQSKSLKYINTVTLVLKGAPPAQPVSPSTDGGSGTTNAVTDTGDGSGSGEGAADEEGTQTGDATAADGKAGAEAQAAASKASRSESEAKDEAGESQGADHVAREEQASESEAEQSSPAWHIYQMMNAADTAFETDDDPYALVPLAGGAALALALAALVRRHVAFRLHTGQPVVGSIAWAAETGELHLHPLSGEMEQNAGMELNAGMERGAGPRSIPAHCSSATDEGASL